MGIIDIDLLIMEIKIMQRKSIIDGLRAKISVNGHIIGASVGSGLTAIYTSMGGADFFLP